MSPQHRTARRTRSRRTLAAAVVTLPLLAVPVAAPAVAVASTVDTRGWGGYGGLDFGGDGGYGESYGGAFGGSYGSTYGGTYGDQGGSTSPTQGTQTTAQDATAATSTQSTGVVLIDTVLDYDEGEAAGTGMVLTSDGTVVTNHHVVAGATSITVTVPSTGKKYAATVVGYDTSRDVAVLKLQGASGLSTISTDTSLSAGEAVTAVGNAEGAGTLTAAPGTVLTRRTTIDVSGDDGTTEHLTGLIENSSDVVSGDSGGALLDADDEVVGMNVAASSGTAQVTGYAIPIVRVLRIAGKIEAGTASSTITIGNKAALGVQLDSTSTAPYVAGVVSGGAAARAGIASGDTITSVGGTSVSSYDALTQALSGHQPGDRVKVGWTDSAGAAHSATVTLGTAPIG
ncbi:trypsin-like peptidase domain-containing protein [Nocardioides sp. BP30]|uniref:S1C family serine protease n=1 Tax=Nocardioides sp. BP30 TaxID=3036374 RepID=UPI0024688C5D|nr:trypsin-like peptidase domain-containing protein [Nocardioides sp. BP30]WGL50566.1 trypsin-like peptidase domain-containing protein [Nocardioides sp. BP30]